MPDGGCARIASELNNAAATGELVDGPFVESAHCHRVGSNRSAGSATMPAGRVDGDAV